jgi:phage terminase large subunit-like protein
MTAPFSSWLHEYMHKCRSGEIVVGQEMLQMFDILDEHFRDPDIRFELDEAHKRIKFIEEKCRHFEAPFAGKPFKLELFQKAFVEALHGFKMFDDELQSWVRLYQEALFLVGRKNGKTPFIGALNLSEFFCGPKGLRILCSSNDYEQASLMFDAINAMREESPSLAKVTRKNLTGIYFGNPKRRKNTGKFSYANKGQIKKISAKTGAKEGRNIGVGAIDEVHEMKDNSSVMPVRQALSTQNEPLFYELTTEGFTNDGYLDGRLIEARQVLNRELHRPRWLTWLYTQDSEQEVWQDERTWPKSNPGLGSIKKWSFLRGMVDESKTNKATRIFVLAKDFNIKQNNAAAWLTMDEITNANDRFFDLEEMRGRIAIGGVDLSKSGDLACARAIFLKGGKKYSVSQYFIPESKLSQLSKEDLEKYKEWIRQGRITVSDGNENDFRLVTAWFLKLHKEYGIRFLKIGYDKWSAVYWVKEMEDMGFDMVRVAQDWGPMSEPMKLVEADLRSNLIYYNNDSLDKFCLENTAITVNSKMEQMPIKVQGKEEKKIDGAVTKIICYRVYIDNRSDFVRLSA